MTRPHAWRERRGEGLLAPDYPVVVDRLARIEVKLDEIRHDRADHESRIRTLERWKYALPATFLTAVISALVTIWAQFK